MPATFTGCRSDLPEGARKAAHVLTVDLKSGRLIWPDGTAATVEHSPPKVIEGITLQQVAEGVTLKYASKILRERENEIAYFLFEASNQFASAVERWRKALVKEAIKFMDPRTAKKRVDRSPLALHEILERPKNGRLIELRSQGEERKERVCHEYMTRLGRGESEHNIAARIADSEGCTAQHVRLLTRDLRRQLKEEKRI